MFPTLIFFGVGFGAGRQQILRPLGGCGKQAGPASHQPRRSAIIDRSALLTLLARGARLQKTGFSFGHRWPKSGADAARETNRQRFWLRFEASRVEVDDSHARTGISGNGGFGRRAPRVVPGLRRHGA
jgi:hypothetical protein